MLLLLIQIECSRNKYYETPHNHYEWTVIKTAKPLSQGQHLIVELGLVAEGWVISTTEGTTSDGLLLSSLGSGFGSVENLEEEANSVSHAGVEVRL